MANLRPVDSKDEVDFSACAAIAALWMIAAGVNTGTLAIGCYLVGMMFIFIAAKIMWDNRAQARKIAREDG